ncbi:MAG TPA: sugar phosphate isomerase/epimerase [Firmicutes bacterium]|nr:sugar phosphate isomerase/epimerase [Bacillota bacterium]
MKIAAVISVQKAKFEAVVFKEDLEGSIERIASLGFDGVELAVRNPDVLKVEVIRDLVKSHGLVVPAIGTGQAYGEDGLSFADPSETIRRETRRRVRSHIELASYLGGAPVIIGLIRGRVQPGVTRKEALGWVQGELAEAASYAASRGTSLVIEPINRYETDIVNTVDEAIELIETVGKPNVGLLLDTFHMNIEEPDMLLSIRRAAPYIKHVHFADSNRWAPGCGHLDFAEITRLLRDVGYEGFVSAEILPRPDPVKAVEAAAATMKWLRDFKV